MEHHWYQEQQQEEGNTSSVVGGTVGGNKGSFLCRQSCTRWIPTADQIRILRDLYYNMRIRSPTAKEIQKISVALRKYGKNEGKNVFYWFQNHKARERQKKRLTMDASTTSTPSNSTITIMSPVREQECYLSGGGGDGSGMESSMGWVGLESTAMPWIYDYPAELAVVAMVAREIETLPLFPIKQEEEGEEEMEQEGEFIAHSHLNNRSSTTTNNNGTDQRFPADHHHRRTHQAASLELSLNSYYYPPRSTSSDACSMTSPGENFLGFCGQA